jgi:hypothetical protein
LSSINELFKIHEFLLQIDLTHRFKDVEALENVLYPHLKIKRMYPIIKVRVVPSNFSTQTILLFLLDNGRESVILMNSANSFAFTHDDIKHINSPSEL